MINKFQQGGQFDQIYALINQQPEQALQELVKQGLNPQQIMQLVAQGAQEGKIKPEIAQAIEKALQQQTKIARHGTKLNYLKSLKHQCAEDEEVYYFKKGGSVGCGCRKKEDGGEIQKAGTGTTVVGKFKEDQKNKKAEQSVKPNPYASEDEKKFLAMRDKNRLTQQQQEEAKEKAYKKRIEQYNKQYTEDSATTDGEEYPLKERGKNVQKKACGSKLKNGTVAAFKAKCGKKMKKHFNGGKITVSLN